MLYRHCFSLNQLSTSWQLPCHFIIMYTLTIPVNVQFSQHHSHPPHRHYGHKASDLGKGFRKGAGLCANPKSKFRLWMAGFVLSMLSVMTLLLLVMLGYMPSPSCTNVYFSPHTTIGLNVSGMFCDQLTIKKYSDNSPASQWSVSLYFFNQMPNLSTVYDFTISENVTLPKNEFYKWSFYLHEGSSYTIEACNSKNVKSDDVKVCIIGGDNDLNHWMKTRSCEHAHSIKSCNDSNFSYFEVINETNTYYFVYSTQNSEANLMVNMTYVSLEYSVEESNVYDHH